MNRRRQNQPKQHRKERDEPGYGGRGGAQSRPASSEVVGAVGEPVEQDDDDGVDMIGVHASKEEGRESRTSSVTSHDLKVRPKHSKSRTRKPRPRTLAAGVLVILATVVAVERLAKARVIDSFRVLQAASLLPVVLVGGSALLPNRTAARTRQSLMSDRALSAALVLSVVGAQLPIYVGAALASAALLLFALATLPSHHPDAIAGDVDDDHTDGNDKKASADPLFPPTAVPTTGPTDTDTDTTSPTTAVTPPIQIINATVVLLVVLLTENFMVWVVAATFKPGQHPSTEPPPLQDNGRIVLNYVLAHYTKHQVVSGLRRLWNVQWSLVACVATSFAVVDVWHHPQRQLYGVARRAVLTLAAARALRTISFLLTVLPSQVPNCYRTRFPVPPPVDWYSWIQVGLLPASHGGCNDLIVSGHATVVTTLACVSTSVSSDPVFQACLWVLLLLDFAIEVYEGFHYSVDMWLGCVLVCLIWRVFRPLENEQRPSSNNEGIGRRTFRRATRKDAGWYGLPTAIAYLQATGMFPRSLANGVIVLYVATAVVVFARSLQLGTGGGGARTAGAQRPPRTSASSYVHYAQHILLCVGLITLVTYL